MVLAGVLEQRDAHVRLRRVREQLGQGHRRVEVGPATHVELDRERPESLRIGPICAEKEQVGRLREAHGPDQVLPAPTVRDRTLVEDERRVADTHLLTQVGRLPGRRQVGDVPDDGRALPQAVASLQPLGDPIGDGDHGVAAADQQPLDRRREPRPDGLAVGNTDRVLVRVVDQLGAAQPGREVARDKRRDVVGVHGVRPFGAGAARDRAEGEHPPEHARQPPRPGRRRGGAQPEAAGYLLLVTPTRQMDDHDVVACVGQRASLPEDPAIVDNSFVKQNGYSHRNSGPVPMFCDCMRRLSVTPRPSGHAPPYSPASAPAARLPRNLSGVLRPSPWGT